MPSSPPVHELTDTVLAEMYDTGSYSRGQAYAADGRVRLVDVRPDRVTGLVQGTERDPYLAYASWFGSGRGIVIDDRCSCPLGGACKHCVALVLTARASAAPRAANWRRALSQLSREGDVPHLVPSPLALEVAGIATRRATVGAHRGPTITVRPRRLGASDRWIASGASWRDLTAPFALERGEVVDAHRHALRALYLTRRTVTYSVDSGPIALDQFGPDFWDVLRRALDAGVTLVDGRGNPHGVELADTPARLVVDLRATDDGGVELTAALHHDDVDVGAATLVGQPAHGLVSTAPDLIRLVPLDAPLHQELADLIDDRPLHIPAGDVDELVDDYQPILARFATVGSSDGSVPILDTRFEGPVLRIDRPTLDGATVTWLGRYRRGTRVIDRPLDQVADPYELDLGRFTEKFTGPGGRPRTTSLQGADTVALFDETIPWLESTGHVVVEVTGDQPELRAATDAPQVAVSVADATRTDWFDLTVEVSVDGESVPFAQLFTALVRDDPVLILPSGTWVRLDRPEFARLAELITEARGLAEAPGSATVQINRFQTNWFDELAALGVVQSQSARWAESVSRMHALAAPVRVEPPEKLDATLRPYQRDGLDWLVFLHRNRLGGILADDMGLGKTVQTLALCLQALEDDPDARFLVVAPTSVVENWRAEAERFAPGLTTCTIRETAARRGEELADTIGDAQLVVTSYALFRLEYDAYAALDWNLLLLDEAQMVKNHRGKTYRCVRGLEATVKIAITGTPLENSLMDLWALLSIVAPGLYPDPKRFTETYRKPIEAGEAPELLATLRRRIAPLMRRRTKSAVLTDLPPKLEQTIDIELSARHRRIYETQLQRQRSKVLGLVGSVDEHRFEILKSLTLLRQLSLDPALVDEAHEAVGSAKIDRLVEDLTQVLAEGHRALVFSQFTRFLARVRDRFTDAGIAHAYLDGRTRNRSRAIDSFKNGDVPVFVISLKAGGVGLNLTEADYCFVLDPWWNPAVETQAVDRTHRIGQTNPVVVYRYVAAGTIEEKVMALKARKSALFDRVVDAESALAGALTEGDIRGLLDLGD